MFYSSFNPCPPTFLKTALKRAQDVIRTNLDLFKVPSTGTEEAIICSSMGDIRSAVSQYHFASLKGILLVTITFQLILFVTVLLFYNCHIF